MISYLESKKAVTKMLLLLRCVLISFILKNTVSKLMSWYAPFPSA